MFLSAGSDMCEISAISGIRAADQAAIACSRKDRLRANSPESSKIENDRPTGKQARPCNYSYVRTYIVGRLAGKRDLSLSLSLSLSLALLLFFPSTTNPHSCPAKAIT